MAKRAAAADESPAPQNRVLPKAMAFTVGAFVLVVMFRHPAEAADFARWAGQAIATIADGIGEFFSQLNG